jgi:hypothetical protein
VIKAAIIGIAILVGVVVLARVALWLWPTRITVSGVPTPEDARAKHDRAVEKSKQETERQLEEIRNGTTDDKLRRARARVRDGLQPK